MDGKYTELDHKGKTEEACPEVWTTMSLLVPDPSDKLVRFPDVDEND